MVRKNARITRRVFVEMKGIGISFSEFNYWSSDLERKLRENASQEIPKKWEGTGIEVWLCNQTLGFN